jgi:hypothetical protein
LGSVFVILATDLRPCARPVSWIPAFAGKTMVDNISAKLKYYLVCRE